MLFPIKDYNPTQRTAYLTIALIAINILVFLFQVSDLEIHVAKHAMIPWEVTHFKTIEKPMGYVIDQEGGIPFKKFVYRSHSPLVSLLLSLFMHGSFFHLLGNMLFLWIFGNNIEDHLGMWRFFIFYIICGIGSSLVHILFNFNSFIPVIGASGAVSGVMGAYLVLYPRARVRTLVFILIFVTFVDLPAFVFLFIWLVMQFFLAGGGSGIAWLAHVGGFFIGLFLVNKIKKRRSPPSLEIIQ